MKIKSLTMWDSNTKNMIGIVDQLESITDDPPCVCGCSTMLIDAYLTEQEVQDSLKNKNTFFINNAKYRCAECYKELIKDTVYSI